jgi:hypothetical protein
MSGRVPFTRPTIAQRILGRRLEMNPHHSIANLPDAALPLACPHCNAGMDTQVVGLFWDGDETSWRCLVCGCRTFERAPRSRAEIMADEIWEQLLPSSGEDASDRPHDGEDPEEERPPEAVA